CGRSRRGGRGRQQAALRRDPTDDAGNHRRVGAKLNFGRSGPTATRRKYPGNKPRRRPVSSAVPLWANRRTPMSDHDTIHDEEGASRRSVLKCMTWAGAGVLWTVAGGVPRSLGIIGEAQAQTAGGLTFLQISDSHIGFDKPANPNATATLEEAIAKVKALPTKPAFMLHTGDITHLSKPKEFDDAKKVISTSGLDVHYVPGEHDIIDEEVKLYRERYGKNAKGAGWYSFDAGGVHFIGLVNVANPKAAGLGALGDEQLAWLADDLKGKAASTPIVVFAHIPLWVVYEQW